MNEQQPVECPVCRRTYTPGDYSSHALNNEHRAALAERRAERKAAAR